MIRKFKYILLFVGLLGWGDNVLQAQENTVPYKEQLITVEEKLKSGQLLDALKLMDEITDKHPNASEVFYGKSLLLAQIGNINSAIENARLAYTHENSLLYGGQLIDLYKRQGDRDNALHIANELRDKFPTQTAFTRSYILMLGENKSIPEAENIFQEERLAGRGSDTLDVTLAEAYLMNEEYQKPKVLLEPLDNKSSLQQVYAMLAFISEKDKNSKKAVQILERGLKKTNAPELYLDLADSYKNLGKNKESFDALKKAFDSERVNFSEKYIIIINLLNPSQKHFSLDQVQTLSNMMALRHPRIPESHLIKGEISWKRGDIAEARSLFLTALAMNPRHIDGWRMLINADLAMNDVDQAIAHSREGLSANPNNVTILYFAGLAHMAKEDKDQARALLEAALNHSEEESEYLKSMIYGALGDLYHQLKMEDVSDAAYLESIALDSTNVTALNNLAYYWSLRKKNLDKAAQYAKMANEIEPNSATLQDTYAWVLFQKEEYSDALKWMEKAIKGSEKPTSVLYEHYGDILSKVGKSGDAVKYWQKALELADSDRSDVEKIKLKIKQKKYVE